MLAMPAFVTFPRFPAYENPSPLDINFSNRWAGFDSDLDDDSVLIVINQQLLLSHFKLNDHSIAMLLIKLIRLDYMCHLIIGKQE